MELKMKYQYTYFIYPYVVKEEIYHKYIMRLLKDKKCKLRFFEKEKEIDMYHYFLPNIRKYLFSSFEYSKSKMKKWEQLQNDTKAALLMQQPCVVFEYEIPQNTQGKIEENSGIFFKVKKVELVCFRTGICFLCMKTHIEDTENMEDLLNFNYKFRDIHSETGALKKFDNIKIQTDSFDTMEQIDEWITSITGANQEAAKYNIDTNRFLTYSYVCIDQKDWNDTKGFEEIEHNFYKLANVLPSSDSLSYNKQEKEQIMNISKWKYIRMGFSKQGTCLFTSNMDTYNYTKLPHLFENQYLYTYLLILYQKIYLNKLNIGFQEEKTELVRKKFIEFTKEIYIQDVTNEDDGSLVVDNMRELLGIDNLYLKMKNKYDIMYKEMNIEVDKKVNKYIFILLAVSFIFNMINFILLFLQ